MHDLSETGVWVDNVSVPDDGVDYRTAASVDAPLSTLANRTRALYEFLGSLSGTVSLPAHLSVAGNVNSHGALTASTTFHCAGAATFDSAVTCSAGMLSTALVLSETLNTVNLVSTGGALMNTCAVGNTLSAATATFATANISACNATTLSVGTNSSFFGACTFHDIGYLQGVVTCQGPGRVVRAGRINPVGAGAGSLDPAVCNTWYFDTLTSDVNMTLTGGEGESHEITNMSSAWFVNILLPGGAALAALIHSSGTRYYARVKNIGGTWRLLMATYLP